MEKKLFFLIFLLSLVLFHCQNTIYQKMIEETVTEEYCTEVINNVIALLKEGYVYLDFYKSPIKPKANESYSIEAINLVSELEAIPRKNRKFYEFIRDIIKIVRKTGDGHLKFYPEKSPGGINLGLCIFSLPFKFDVVDELDNEDYLKETYLVITEKKNISNNGENNSSTEYAKYYNKKIKSINGEDPFTFIVNILKDYKLTHNPQSDYTYISNSINEINIMELPLLKEELSNITIIFENDEKITVDYSMPSVDDSKLSGLKEYYLKKIKFNINNNLPIPSLVSIQEEFMHKNDSNYKKRRKLEDNIWNLEDEEGTIKCKVDEEDKKNVLYQNSFSPENVNNFQVVMYQCIQAFYSNKYEIIIIQSHNSGGYSILCNPMTQFFRPKIYEFIPHSQKDTDLNYEFLEQANLIYETCEPYDQEKLFRGKTDDYGNGVIHNRTKDFYMYNLYSRKSIKDFINNILATNNTKKPTEIIIFTDGFTFSCGSGFVKGLQVFGSAIVVGYNAKQGINSSKDFDASQSNSGVEQFINSKYSKILENLGFMTPRVTNVEQFDPNDLDDDNMKIPMEFKKYPVDELSNIHT